MAKAPRAAPSGSIFVLAGCNGGKSSIGGAAFRQSGSEFFNPDEAAQRIAPANAKRNLPLTQAQINGATWNEGRRLLQRAIDEHADFAFETALGGKAMTALVEQAALAGRAVHVWFAGLTDVALHIDRVQPGGKGWPQCSGREDTRAL